MGPQPDPGLQRGAGGVAALGPGLALSGNRIASPGRCWAWEQVWAGPSLFTWASVTREEAEGRGPGAGYPWTGLPSSGQH